MINMSAQNQRYYCRTKDLLWYRETKIAVEKVLHGDMTTADIRRESLDKNIFNASSTSRSKEIAQAVTRRVNAVDSAYFGVFIFLCGEEYGKSAVAMYCDGDADRSYLSGVYGFRLSGKIDPAGQYPAGQRHHGTFSSHSGKR